MEAKLLAALLLSYLLGSIPFTQLVARAVGGIDLRQVGSRNVGGRNLSRQLGLGWGLLGGALDVLKGASALWLAQGLGLGFTGQLLSAVAVVAGHNWPVWLRFHGGKGLLAAVGALAVVALPETALTFALGALVLRLTRNVTLATLAGLVTLLATAAWLQRPTQLYTFIFAISAVVLLASLPSIWQTLSTRGGLAAYLREPDAVYRQDPQDHHP